MGFIIRNLKDKKFTSGLSVSRWRSRFTFSVTTNIVLLHALNTLSDPYFSINLTQRERDKSSESHGCHALDSLHSPSCDNDINFIAYV
jgi:hypothetical protein